MECAVGAVKLKLASIDLLERDVKLRMPFRFGVVTLTESPQAFARARIRLEDGREAEGAAAELLAPKWFDKDPALSNEDNYDQLRVSLGRTREALRDLTSSSISGSAVARPTAEFTTIGKNAMVVPITMLGQMP